VSFYRDAEVGGDPRRMRQVVQQDEFANFHLDISTSE
jgi:hypothetical protein